ncbi:nicotinate phosphoribosyltransferase [Methanofollis sp. W23]|uniref:nicotinate phosphoribosyltransferase n=1 Tax=Methanofollis sp. W23 TaxID=2817849 RepID=UPI001AE6019D|nr:nicotinate phosphoribosyltransferase [Methanofollis sp. W23]MBP2145816.1 nicotinate phosphoribosyltransferase [Methanofollis sp. W23]
MSRFHMVDEGTIARGECTDIYFARCEEVLEKEGIDPVVTMEVTTAGMPYEWGIFCGLHDVLALLSGLSVDVEAMPEGSVFRPREPVLRITGRYREFGVFETALLGFLCHASGIATAAAHIKHAAGERKIYSFGSRRQHPAIAPMIERSAWIGGVDGVSNTTAPPGMPVVGTMPHAFVMCHENPEEAWTAFDRYAASEVPRLMLCDTFGDEKEECLRAAELGFTKGVRLDTPRSRRGNMRSILEEVRWELDSHGHEDVEIFLSGGITREDILAFRDIVEAFGVGGSIANAPVIDFSLDIIEVEGRSVAKRGKWSGVKQVYLFPDGRRKLLPISAPAPEGAAPLLVPAIRDGTIMASAETAEARARVLAYLAGIAGSV